VRPDLKVLTDLTIFARAELASGDIEPWAAVLAAAHALRLVDAEGAAWAVKLYNAYDDLASAWQVAARWPGPAAWAADPDTTAAAAFPCSRERRNLRGGLVRRHLDSYTRALAVAGTTQAGWLGEAYPPGTPPEAAFGALLGWLRQVWGVGRQTAFEWAEFAGKVLHLPVTAPDACLWESSGPRESLERIYGQGAPAPSRGWLDDAAGRCRDHLAAAGVRLPWWDFETVICDFNVMRKGRYYPGQHLAMIRDEIAGLPAGPRGQLEQAYTAAIPEVWADVRPGVDKTRQRAYAAQGVILGPHGPVPGEPA
jgi:hypothetical protein